MQRIQSAGIKNWLGSQLMNRLLKLNYSQTCSHEHLYKMTSHLRRLMLSPPKQISIQSLLYKTNTCLTRAATTFFVSQMKKTCLKQPLKNYFVKLERYFVILSLFNVYKNWTVYKIM